MKEYKNYKNYFIDTKTYKERAKIEDINKITRMTQEELEKMEDWEKSRLSEYLTNKQSKLLYSNDLKTLKELLKKYKPKALEQLKQAKEDAQKQYNDIKQLEDIKHAIFEIEWTKNRGAYGYQCQCTAQVEYKNGTITRYTSERTGGCGYDKPSSALSYALNHTAKILLIKHGARILKDEERHYKYYACENMYFSYGVGVNSYITMFQNMGYKVTPIYHNNEDITIIIEKGRKNED